MERKNTNTLPSMLRLEYLHNPPKCDRNPVSHGNICMKKILLDEQKNARLLFFAPTSVEGGMEEQFEEDKKKDVQAFKDVSDEVLKQVRKKTASYVQADIQKAATMTEMKILLLSALRQEGINLWTRSPDDDQRKEKCEICCVNKPEQLCKRHIDYCVTNIKICVGCLWNWRYNPVKCHSCDQEKIRCPVGDGWGAILIAGTDEKHAFTKHFEDDIEKIKDKLITEATLMGVRGDNVITVKKSITTYGEQLDKAFSRINNSSEIDTLVLVYSGHHGDQGFRLGSDLLTDGELEKKVNGLKPVKKVIAIFDCCRPKKLNLGEKTVLQFNAVTSTQKASCEPTGSQFINDIIDVFTKPWECVCCQNTPIIRDFNLLMYFSRHTKSELTEPSHQTYASGQTDNILTFRPVDSGWLEALKMSLESNPLQDLRIKLFELYNTTASTVRVRLNIDEALEKVYVKPILTLKENGKEKEDCLEFDNIFRSKDGKMAKTIFVEGEPGTGKSTLCKKIVRDWCKTNQGFKGQAKTEWHDILSQFKFVFYIILREAKNECQIENMILNNIMDRIGVDKESAGKLWKSFSCLLLLDGLDEWQHPKKCNRDERIPHVDMSFKNCTILITTRPYKLADIRIGCSQIDNHVMLKGVECPRELVDKILSKLSAFHGTGEKPDHEECICVIRDRELWHFRQCPIVLAHIVWLWYKRRILQDMKVSDIYRLLLKERWVESCEKRNSCTKTKYRDVIRALSQIAFDNLFADDENNTIVFQLDDEVNTNFESHKAASLESGILSCTNVPGDSPQYHFLHKTFQEYLAALFLSEDITNCCLHIINTYKKHRKESGISLSQVLLFLCGLNAEAAEELSKTMNELFTDFCDRDGYSDSESRMLQDIVIQGQKELDRSNQSGVKLCLQHINIHELLDKENKWEEPFSHLRHASLGNICMSEEQFSGLLQFCLGVGRTGSWKSVLNDCSIEQDEDVEQLQHVFDQQVESSDSTTTIELGHVTITARAFMNLVDWVTRCSDSVKCNLVCLELKPINYVKQIIFPMVVPQPISADYTTELRLHYTKMSTEQICQIVGRMNQLHHSVNLELNRCTEIANECDPLRIQMGPPINTLMDCTKLIEIDGMDISETLLWYVVISVIHFGYNCYVSYCDMLSSDVPHIDNLHFSQMLHTHLPARTAKLIFDHVSMSDDVEERVACEAAKYGHLVKCEFRT
ncbi:uncharacterized protein LOC128221082 isoform X2 [Mya arenaria]|uniref:uncharacterized protein LOC128221082 isoform X2 n=1 Tax=Mya arenaria TaxID=6604 RepID=UPI0022E69FCA|nr:uncharacterized protein LOC128221082 isoform X2 [Mya arenaria]